MKVLTVISKVTTSNQTLSIMGVDGEARYLHINDFKTNKNMTMTPISAVKEVMQTLKESN
jgi:hypothetical protein